MEGNKVDGFGKFLIVWTAAFFALLVILALTSSCMPSVEPQKAENGAICLTPEMYQRAIDAATRDGYADGYAKAKAEIAPRADVELNLITRDKLIAFLKADQCDRCTSDVPGETEAESCLDRAECLLNSARNEGWDAYAVIMNFPDGSHAIVAFPLKDGTLAFVEPWTDSIEEYVGVGKTYIPARKVIEKLGILK